MTQHILITGGAGFIGSHLADALLARGYRVTLLDLLHPQIHPDGRQPDYLNPAATLVLGDVRDRALLDKLLVDVDAVYHFASHTGVGQSMYQISDYYDTNLLGTAVLLEALMQRERPLHKLVVASSRAIYGEGAYRLPNTNELRYPLTRPLDQLKRGEWALRDPETGQTLEPIGTAEDKPAHPGSMYAISKLNQEQTIMLCGETYGLPTVSLRFFNVYGPRQALGNPYTGVITAFIQRLANGKPLEVYEDGRESRDFVHVQDVVQACLLALENDAANGHVFNVGTGVPLSLMEIAETVTAAFDGPPPSVSGRFRAGDIRHCHADLTKINRVLGYEPQVSFKAGIDDLVERVRGLELEDQTARAARELEERGLSLTA